MAGGRAGPVLMWSRVATDVEAQALPGMGTSRSIERTGRVEAGLSPRGVRQVIQGPQGLQGRDPLISGEGDFSSLVLCQDKRLHSHGRTA